MGKSVKSLKKVIEECSDTNRHEWPDEARTILEAVRRTSRPTKWKVRRTIAEALLKKLIVPSIVSSGWRLRAANADNPSCDLLLERDRRLARIEIALLRPATPQFKRIHRGQHSESAHALEVVKKQIKKNAVEGAASGEARRAVPADYPIERSYSFGEFDILAVNIHAATSRWTDFRYTLSNWLRHRPGHESLIDAVQAVPLKPNDAWTDDLAICLEWYSRTVESDGRPSIERPEPHQ